MSTKQLICSGQYSAHPLLDNIWIELNIGCPSTMTKTVAIPIDGHFVENHEHKSSLDSSAFILCAKLFRAWIYEEYLQQIMLVRFYQNGNCTALQLNCSTIPAACHTT